jgi:ATP-dependent helicase/nuclease subunit B
MPIEVSPEKATLDRLSDRSDAFCRKAKGIFNGEFYRYLDPTTESGWSRFYSFRITSKDAQYGDYKRSGVLNPGDFEAILRFAEEKAVRLAGEIASGRIDITPYRLNNNSPCSHCEFGPVCRFDWQINNYNSVESLGKDQVLEKLEVRDG